MGIRSSLFAGFVFAGLVPTVSRYLTLGMVLSPLAAGAKDVAQTAFDKAYETSRVDRHLEFQDDSRVSCSRNGHSGLSSDNAGDVRFIQHPGVGHAPGSMDIAWSEYGKEIVARVIGTFGHHRLTYLTTNRSTPATAEGIAQAAFLAADICRDEVGAFKKGLGRKTPIFVP